MTKYLISDPNRIECKKQMRNQQKCDFERSAHKTLMASKFRVVGGIGILLSWAVISMLVLLGGETALKTTDEPLLESIIPIVYILMEVVQILLTVYVFIKIVQPIGRLLDENLHPSDELTEKINENALMIKVTKFINRI